MTKATCTHRGNHQVSYFFWLKHLLHRRATIHGALITSTLVSHRDLCLVLFYLLCIELIFQTASIAYEAHPMAANPAVLCLLISTELVFVLRNEFSPSIDSLH